MVRRHTRKGRRGGGMCGSLPCNVEEPVNEAPTERNEERNRERVNMKERRRRAYPKLYNMNWFNTHPEEVRDELENFKNGKLVRLSEEARRVRNLAENRGMSAKAMKRYFNFLKTRKEIRSRMQGGKN